MKTSSISPSEWVALLIDKAEELRRVGVLEISTDGVVLAPYAYAQQTFAAEQGQDEEPTIDPWNDALGMGFDPGTELPSFKRQVTSDNDE